MKQFSVCVVICRPKKTLGLFVDFRAGGEEVRRRVWPPRGWWPSCWDSRMAAERATYAACCKLAPPPIMPAATARRASSVPRRSMEPLRGLAMYSERSFSLPDFTGGDGFRAWSKARRRTLLPSGVRRQLAAHFVRRARADQGRDALFVILWPREWPVRWPREDRPRASREAAARPGGAAADAAIAFGTVAVGPGDIQGA